MMFLHGKATLSNGPQATQALPSVESVNFCPWTTTPNGTPAAASNGFPLLPLPDATPRLKLLNYFFLPVRKSVLPGEMCMTQTTRIGVGTAK